jgi:alkanesulfonate monooxygenase SsuD/methylene tetrahydromethanopterin reductase-like flavin-dependent oxidoreductase (luciferase family)
VVTVPVDGEQWTTLTSRIADLGYSTVLMPDGPQLLSPFSALAVAATVSGLRVGTFVLSAPLRPQLTTAREAHSLSILTGGRFELGIGTGRPETRDWTRELGLPYGSAVERLRSISETIDHLRGLDGDRHTPVLMAVRGAMALVLAAAKADIITLATGALATRGEVTHMVTDVRALAADRADEIEFAMSLFVVGDQTPPWTERFIGADAATLIANDSLTMLRGSAPEMADELQRRRDALGTTYISVNAAFYEQLAPVVELFPDR